MADYDWTQVDSLADLQEQAREAADPNQPTYMQPTSALIREDGSGLASSHRQVSNPVYQPEVASQPDGSDQLFPSGGNLQDIMHNLYEKGMTNVRRDLGTRGLMDSSMYAQASARMSGEALLGAWNMREKQKRLELQEERLDYQYDALEQRAEQARYQREQQWDLAMARMQQADAWNAMRQMVKNAPVDEDTIREMQQEANQKQEGQQSQSGDGEDQLTAADVKSEYPFYWQHAASRLRNQGRRVTPQSVRATAERMNPTFGKHKGPTATPGFAFSGGKGYVQRPDGTVEQIASNQKDYDFLRKMYREGKWDIDEIIAY